MDIRGVEITNQLRSAIRAKLLELGVRYDEELPDYILVMVVNKKSRQQMHEDLSLFLEDSTTPFVEWLHDQVLKKLQKVTVAKRKSSRDLVPSIVVKQEEDKKKRKITTSFLDDQLSSSDKDDKQSVLASIQVSSTTSQEPEREKTPERIPEPSIPEDHIEPEVSSSKEKPSKEPTPKTSSKISEPEPEVDSRKESKRDEDRHRSDENLDESRKLKSSVIKPKVTSVVSVKTRLGLVSPKKKAEGSGFRDKGSFGFSRHRDDKRPAKDEHRTSFFRNHFRPSESVEGQKKTDLRSRLGSAKQQEPTKFSPARFREKVDIRERLGQGKVKVKEVEKPVSSSWNKNVKNRLGLQRNHFGNDDGEAKDKDLEEEEEEEEEEVVGPVRSRIIAVTKPKESDEDEEEDFGTEGKLSSKVIVTPRPLKPLQPAQKRATQSLLLRAVAEANQSVVMQKNPEPSLMGKRPVPVRLTRPDAQEVGNNLSVCLNKKKRFVMEKIQVELSTEDDSSKDKNSEASKINDEHLGVVKSLFQKGDNNHTFLVTLNGYNDNSNKDFLEDYEEEEEEDEGLEMEVNEKDELTLSSSHIDYVDENESSFNNILSTSMKKTTEEKKTIDSGKLARNTSITETLPKKRKLSPIVYTRSPSPKNVSLKLGSMVSPKTKKSSIDSAIMITDKSNEKCRYWPNCTLGNKCAFSHPLITCSAFPACKFGDKCAYQHPKCKFGISCAKPGCIFSHPVQLCKFYPFCTKPGCTFSHSPAKTMSVPNPTKQRAKFTWKRQD